MLYRPAFCCNCGEKVVRDEWRLWTSRRFCALCATEHQGIDLLPKVVVAAGLLAVVFGVATSLRSPQTSAFESPTLVQKPKPNLKPPTLNPQSIDSTRSTEADPALISNSSVKNDTQQSEQPQREKRTSDESVFYCGAITKKGTPCTRRVKTKGFCWQHAKSGQMAPARF
jgi:hypothetical protein